METVLSLLEGSFGALVMALSGIACMVTLCVVFPIVACTVNGWWGLLCFVFPGPATIAFSVLHFKKAWLPLLITVVALLISVGVFLMRAFLATFFVEAPV